MRGKSKFKVLITLFMAIALLLTSCGGANSGITRDITLANEGLLPTPYENPPMVSSALTVAGIISLIGQNLTAGAAKSAGSSGFGWVMNMLGMGDPVAQTTIDMLVSINSNIEQLSKSVTEMQKQLNAVDYNTLASPLQSIVSKITRANRSLTSLAGLSPVTDDTSESDKAYRQEIIDELCTWIGGPDGIIANQYAIRDAMLGTGMAGGGMIVKWSKWVVGRQRFFNKESSDMQRELYNYWLTLQAIQETLIIEYMHYKNHPLSKIQEELDGYNLDMSAQKECIPWELPCESYDDSTFVIFPSKPWSYMLDTNVFGKSMLTRNMAIGIIGIMNTEQPRYPCQTHPFYGWELPDSQDIGVLRSMFVELVFQGIPEDEDVRGWAIDEGWKSIPNVSGKGFSFWTSGIGTGDNRYLIVYRSQKKGLDLDWYTTEHPLLPVRRILPVGDAAGGGEFYFYY